MLSRILTAIIGIPILLYVVFTGGALFLATVCAFALIGIYEYSRMIQAKNIGFCPIVYAFPFLYMAPLYYNRPDLSLQMTVAFVLVVLARQLWRFPEFNMVSVGASLTAGIYPTLLLGNVYLLRVHAGLGLTLVTMLGIMAYDTMAYFIGVKFGKRRPWPLISPKKSVEGVLGGFTGSLTVAVIATQYVGIALWQSVVIGLGIGLMGQVGDLAESAVKRYAGVKDSGKLLPGHGGVLDRFDSLMFAASFVYWLWTAFILR